VLNCHTEPFEVRRGTQVFVSSLKVLPFSWTNWRCNRRLPKKHATFYWLATVQNAAKRARQPKRHLLAFCTPRPVVGMGRYWGLFGMVWACPGVLVIFLTSKTTFQIVVDHWCHFACSLCHWTPERRKKVWGRCGRWGITSHIETWIPLLTCCCRSYYYCNRGQGAKGLFWFDVSPTSILCTYPCLPN
jgi:hypothetical protein